jgi:glucose/arabinose dehydrogenase
MKLIVALLFAILTLGGGVYLLTQLDAGKIVIGTKSTPRNQERKSVAFPTENPEGFAVIAEGLDTPWAIAILPDSSLLVTERPGRVRIISPSGVLAETPVNGTPEVRESGEGGLLGIAVHPKFSQNQYIYLYYTYSSSGNQVLNRVSRYTYENNRLSGELVIIDAIPGSSNHNGGRIRFGPDGMLYVGTGDAEEPSEAQNTSSLAGKILRIEDDSRVPADNPFHNAVYSYGHRNVQGLAWDSSGKLWATEHGRSGINTGFDEVNQVQRGHNYGWPIIQGDETRPGVETAKRNSGATATWAPSGADFIGESLFFAGLRGRTLYEAVMIGTDVTELREHFPAEFGRLREVIKGINGMLYISTSNRDGRGLPGPSDDRIIRINPQKLK